MLGRRLWVVAMGSGGFDSGDDSDDDDEVFIQGFHLTVGKRRLKQASPLPPAPAIVSVGARILPKDYFPPRNKENVFPSRRSDIYVSLEMP